MALYFTYFKEIPTYTCKYLKCINTRESSPYRSNKHAEQLCFTIRVRHVCTYIVMRFVPFGQFWKIRKSPDEINARWFFSLRVNFHVTKRKNTKARGTVESSAKTNIKGMTNST